MSALSADRNALAAHVTEALEAAGISANVYPYLSERVSPPCVEVYAGTPYLEEQNFGSVYKARYSVRLTVPAGTNDKESETLDELLEGLVLALEDEASLWQMEGLSFVGVVQANNANYLAIDVRVVNNQIKFGGTQ